MSLSASETGEPEETFGCKILVSTQVPFHVNVYSYADFKAVMLNQMLMYRYDSLANPPTVYLLYSTLSQFEKIF